MRPTLIRLRAYLLLLVLGAMLPGAGLTALLIAQSFSESRAVVERRLLDAARVDAAALDRAFENDILVLQALASAPALDAGDLEQFYLESRRVQLARNTWFTVILLSPDGRQLVNTRLPWGTALPAVTEPDSLHETVSRRQPMVGSLGRLPLGESGFGFAIRVPVERDGAPKYVLTAVLKTSDLRRLIASSLPASDEWTRTILDPRANVAARTRDGERFEGRPSTATFGAAVLSGVPGIYPETSIDGSDVYAALTRGTFGWTAAVVVPRDVLDAPVRRSTVALAGGGLLLMLGSLTALLLVSQRLSDDISASVRVAEAVAQGRTLAVPPAHVSETRQLQDALKTAAALLEQRQRERDAEVQRAGLARQDAEDANRTKDQFLAVLGHELRNPLAPALTALELMQRTAPDVCQRERDVLNRQIRHLMRLVDDLLDLSRLARGKVELRWSRFQLRSVIDRAVDMAQPLLDRGRHKLTVDVAADGLPLAGDEDRLVQVFGNLLTNAARYTPPGGQISLRAEVIDDMVVVACEDNGPGIPESLRPMLFDAFAQGPRPLDRRDGGLGLGLSLARSFTALHHGTLELETPASGQGSRFIVRLPIARGGAEAHVAPEVRPAAMRGRRRVLVVDDNSDAAEMLRQALEQAGHRVAVAADGAAALELAETFRPEAAVLDIGLPGMSGYELARCLRSTHPDARLIAVTGFGQPGDIRQAERAGFDCHCTKPVALSTLLAQLDEPRAPTTGVV